MGDGYKGPKVYDRVLVPLVWMTKEVWAHWLRIRHVRADPKELAYLLVFAPVGRPLTETVRAAGLRWGIEESIRREQGGRLDEYEVRHWEG